MWSSFISIFIELNFEVFFSLDKPLKQCLYLLIDSSGFVIVLVLKIMKSVFCFNLVQT